MQTTALLFFIILVVSVHHIEGTVRITRTPPAIIYTSVGETVRFNWNYTVGNKELDFGYFVTSPLWYFYDSDGEKSVIAVEDGLYYWSWRISNFTCPPRLLYPTVRVSKESVATLVISNVAKNDSGWYEISLTLRTSPSITNKVELVVKDKPEIDNGLSSRNNISSISGDITQLRCVARGDPVPNITWYAPDGKVLSTGTTSYPGGSNLTLLITRKQDYGMYRCRASNMIGVTWHNITVTQKCHCKYKYEKYKMSSERKRSIIKEPVISITLLVTTIVSGTVNILLILNIKYRQHKKRKELFSAERNRKQPINDYNNGL